MQVTDFNDHYLTFISGARGCYNIIKVSLSINVCRLYCITGNVYGEGVYFAVDASVSAKHSLLDANGNRYIFLCSALNGEYTLSTKGIKTPPVKNIETQEWYDSVCDNFISPTMFIIFNDIQAYPKYLIIFRQHSLSPWCQLSWWEPLRGKINRMSNFQINDWFVLTIYLLAT